MTYLKDDFPHKLANSKTMFYIGNAPYFSYFQTTGIKDYSEFYSKN
jgi:hypothetical protein